MKCRHQRSRAAGSKLADGVLCVSRPSIWGNPWVGPDAVPAYKMFIEQVVQGGLSLGSFEPALRVDRKFEKPLDCWKELRGLIFEYRRDPKDVACWCPLDQRCHGDVILAIPFYCAWNRV